MNFDSYDRITDTLMYFTDSITLKFTVVLAKINNKTNTRRFFQYEVEKASKYTGGDPTYNINRNMSFFFNIDIKDEFGGGFVIRPGDAYMLLDMINRRVLPWYYKDSGQYAFQYVENTLAITEYKPAIYTQSETRHLLFEPSVICNEDGQYSHSCKITINGLNRVEITLEKLMEFVRLMSTDMYATACALTNYAKIKPYGTNLIRPYGLGGGRVEDTWGDDTDNYTKDTNNQTKGKINKGKNSFLDSL